MPPPAPAEFRERLWPPLWLWLLALAWAAMLGVAYGYAISTPVGWLVTVVTAAVAVAGLVDWSTRVTVDGTGITVGRVHLPVQFVGTATPLDAQEARQLRGVGADARAFLLVRGWVPRAVRVDVDDPLDPTPYWYVASRRPDALAAALRSAAGAASVR